MKQEKLKNGGITLIALIITIIVMLILVGVTVTTALNGGLIGKTQEAKTKTEYEEDKEMLLASVIGAMNNNAELNFDKLNENLPEGFTKAENGGYTSKSGNTYYVDENGNITDKPPLKTAAELFDADTEKLSAIEGKTDFTTDGKLHIGDFVNYDAGNWTEKEIEEIKVGPNDSLVQASGVSDCPNLNFQFGGFKVEDSRNGNAAAFLPAHNRTVPL